ncbi:hypothetical protein GOBAR_AA06835 [Gossypium barbadense]|uniref:HMA domain-containing protein n=1 Tax=Gossypium barbadense TaxID=3634 RepID=A0A2P5YDP3_GOSBA|nr:hypothetical protein GOBAR_AA06835 [Gossypium barbadense]
MHKESAIVKEPTCLKATFFSVPENMKQKIVIKVSMHCSKCRTEALQVAAVAYGVNSVALHGPEKDKLMILGEGVDVACLAEALRKKLCHATIEIVEEFECYRVVADPSPAPCTIM